MNGIAQAEAPRVMSILSAGVHSPYAKYAEDPELSQGSYSIKNAADAGGFYNDIFLDVFAERWGRRPTVFYINRIPSQCTEIANYM